MTSPAHLNPNVRHDAVFLFDAYDANPNGDPDNAGAPRTDPETGHGLVTAESLKRKVRDVTAMRVTLGELPTARNQIFITSGVALNTQQENAYAALGQPTGKDNANHIQAARQHMIDTYFDVRMFGAVMSTGTGTTKANCGRATGPIAVGMARTIDPITVQHHTLTRVTKTKAGNETDSEMGNKATVPYGLYQTRIHYSPNIAVGDVTPDDLDHFWSTLAIMFQATASANRNDINPRLLAVFSHSNALGNKPARELTDLVTAHTTKPTPRDYTDYTVTTPTNIPDNITYTRLI